MLRRSLRGTRRHAPEARAILAVHNQGCKVGSRIARETEFVLTFSTDFGGKSWANDADVLRERDSAVPVPVSAQAWEGCVSTS